MNILIFVLWALAAVLGLVFVVVLIKFFGLWLRALVSGATVGLGRLIGMWIRKVNAKVVVDSRIMLMKGGMPIHTDLLETHYLTGGDVVRVSRALIAAAKAGIELPFERAAAIDLAGRDVLEAVKTSVNPKVIDCPNPETGKKAIDAVSKDGIQVKAKARVTVRVNIDALQLD